MNLSIKNVQDFLGSNWQLDEFPTPVMDEYSFRLSTRFLIKGEMGPKTISEAILKALESCPMLAERLTEIETVKGAFREYMAEAKATIEELRRYESYYKLHKELLLAKSESK